jgi:hypothetical protein
VGQKKIKQKTKLEKKNKKNKKQKNKKNEWSPNFF